MIKHFRLFGTVAARLTDHVTAPKGPIVRAVVVDEPGPAEHLRIVDRPVPTPAEDEVLVQVHATSVNRADILQRQGNYPPPDGASDILGLDVAGEVVQVGDAVTGWQPGDRVCSLLAGGGYAERVAVPAGKLQAPGYRPPVKGPGP